MKFESKFGIGEIVIYQPCNKAGHIASEMLEVVAIVFEKECTMIYCRDPRNSGIYPLREHDLIGDPDFNQETGTYLPDPSQSDDEL